MVSQIKQRFAVWDFFPNPRNVIMTSKGEGEMNNISLQEMEHMNLLHNEVTDLIKKYREQNGEPPADMMAIYNYLHEEQIEKAAEVKTMQSMYKAEILS